MIETNVRILAPGMQIALPVRRVKVQGTTNTPELREKVCYRLRQENGLIAAPCQDEKGILLVVTDAPLPSRQIVVDDWTLNLTDTNEAAILNLHTAEGQRLLPELVERMMTHAVASKELWWSFDSMRLWYEYKPFQVRDGIEAYRRFALSALFIEDEGVGVAVDVETAFFTCDSVADFFDPRVSRQQQEVRQKRFEALTRRQKGQHGTLLYDNGVHQGKCYFAGILAGKTCGNASPKKVRGKKFSSLLDYYRSINPKLKVHPNTPVAMVSFPGLEHTQPVAADRLWVRVMNDELPSSLSQVDKIAPTERRLMIQRFWQTLGNLSFCQVRELEAPLVTSKGYIAAGRSISCAVQSNLDGITLAGCKSMSINADTKVIEPSGQGILPLSEIEEAAPETAYTPVEKPASKIGQFIPGFWQPDAARVKHISFPVLYFGKGQTLAPPENATAAHHKVHFQQRLKQLEAAGAYHFPPLMERELVGIYPDNDDLCHAAEELMESLCVRLQSLTGRPFEYRLLPYETLEEATEELRQEKQPSTAIFILNDEPEAYAEVAHGLKEWRVKRITRQMLRSKYRDLTQGARTGGIPDMKRGQRSWDSFCRMTALDALQVMDGVPYRLDQAGEFEAQLIIDVSYDRRYYSLSLLVARQQDKHFDFRLVSHVERKPDDKHEAINKRMLKDDIIKFVSHHIVAGRDAPLASLLIARDGRIVGEELQALTEAMPELVERGCLTEGARVETAELHKQTEMQIRLWDIDECGRVSNVLEGVSVRLSDTMTVLTTTGAGTLSQGTADPMLIVVQESSSAIDAVTQALGISAHLNWSSPEVAQRLPMPFKRTDEVLKARSEQELRRIR